MSVRQSKTISVSINCPLESAYEFLAVPENFPKWASGLSSALEQSGDEWIAQTPQGRARIRFAERNPYGVLDHFVFPALGVEIYVPMRIIANGTGCEVMLTLLRLPEMSDEQFAQDAEWVNRDLITLKELLEA